MQKLKVVELFAGVGGFRVGLERSKKYKYDFVFVNQWEPKTKIQHAYNCYVKHFGTENVYNEDIKLVKDQVPLNADLLVGGFPCQDYSVATVKAEGIEGKKGVLWWEISWILKNKKPKMLLLENVDRLLKSPSYKRGRDFAIMLSNLNKLGYNAEWQVINAAEYGFVQRRKRVFIFAYRRDAFNTISGLSEIVDNFKNNNSVDYAFDSIKEHSIFTNGFDSDAIENENKCLEINGHDEFEITVDWKNGKFLNKGYMYNGHTFYYSIRENVENVKKRNLFEVLQDVSEIEDKYILNKEKLDLMKKTKAAKKIWRTPKKGNPYIWAEGNMPLYDNINKSSRTVITSEGTINRSTHIIKLNANKYRFITPIEAERLNTFEDNWTEGLPERARYFCMGNALIVDLIPILTDNINDFYNRNKIK